MKLWDKRIFNIRDGSNSKLPRECDIKAFGAHCISHWERLILFFICILIMVRFFPFIYLFSV